LLGIGKWKYLAQGFQSIASIPPAVLTLNDGGIQQGIQQCTPNHCIRSNNLATQYPCEVEN